jgi:hypothetical protein
MLSYGMNTNITQMALRCPAAINLGICKLDNHRMVFSEHADVEESIGDTIYCVLWDITDECERILDKLEGYPNYYDKKRVDILYQNNLCQATIYYMTGGYTSYRPPTAYYQHMLEEGYQAHGIDLSQIYDAIGFDTLSIEKEFITYL